MNFDTLKTKFFDYLANKSGSETVTKNKAPINSNTSILSYSIEFKQFLEDEAIEIDDEALALSMDELEDIKIVDGEIVLPDNNEDETTENYTLAIINDALNDENVIGLLDENNDGKVDESELKAFIGDLIKDDSELSFEELANKFEIEKTNDNVAKSLDELYQNEDIIKLLDKDNDGKISEEEKKAFEKIVSGFDGDNTSISEKDIEEALSKLEKGTLLDEVKEEIAKIEKSETKESESAKETSVQQSSSNNISSVSSGGYYSPSSGPAKVKEPTPEEIQDQIDAKNEEISTIEQEAETAVAEQEQLKEEAMKNAGIAEEEIKAYKEEQKELDDNIKGKEEDISKKKDEITEKETTISSNQTYISSLESQISSNESILNSISDDDEDAESQRATINAQIQNLKDEKAKIEKENKTLQDEIDKANEDIKTYENEIKEFEKQKEELLTKTIENSEGFAVGIDDPNVVQELKNSLLEYDKEIISIKENAKTEITTIQNEIKSLKVDLKNAELKEERAKFIADNSATKGLGLTGQELVDTAMEMLSVYGTSYNLCATGVSRTFSMAYGLNLSGNGCDWTDNMNGLVEQGAFIDVTKDYPSSADLANLPAGAVVTWDSTGANTPGGMYGHVCIADGNGGEISDHYNPNIYTNIGGRSDTYHVYIVVE